VGRGGPGRPVRRGPALVPVTYRVSEEAIDAARTRHGERPLTPGREQLRRKVERAIEVEIRLGRLIPAPSA
jgi:hypothetical protein